MNDRRNSSVPPAARRSRFALTTVSVSLAAVMGFTGCETPGRTALAGAAAGAAIGGALHGRGEDALRGAAIGAGAGYLAGRVARNQRERAYREGTTMPVTTTATSDGVTTAIAMVTATSSDAMDGGIMWTEKGKLSLFTLAAMACFSTGCAAVDASANF